MRDDNPALQKLAEELRSFVKGVVPGTKVTENSWGVPTFEKNVPFCLYMVGKNHVTLGFHYGFAGGSGGLARGIGEKLAHVKLRTLGDLQKKELKGLVLAAVRLEEKPPIKGMSGTQA